MTETTFITQLTGIIDHLLATGITSCSNHQARMQLDDLFNQFEEEETTNDRREGKQAPFCTHQFFQDLNDIISVPFGSSHT